MKKMVIGCLVVLVLMFGMSRFTADPKPRQTEVNDLSTVSYAEMENGMIYQASELTVVDRYAYDSYGDKTTVEYYLVVFRDVNERLVAASMPVYPSDDIYLRLNYYATNNSMSIGDCELDCYVKAASWRTSSGDLSELKEYFSDSVSAYSEVLGEPLFPLEWELKFHCGNTEDPLD